MRKLMSSARYNTLVFVLMGAVNFFAVFMLVARQGEGEGAEVQVATTTLKLATESIRKAKEEADNTASDSLEFLLALQKATAEASSAATMSQTESNCQSVLDKLDAKFDARRKARRELPFIPSVWGPEKTYYDRYEPEAVCLDDERFGGNVRFHALGDGPKFVCGVDFIAKKAKENEEGCLVYSVGSNNEIAFEQAVHSNLGCEIHTFDPTIANDTYIGHNVSIFHQLGFAGTDDSVNGPLYKSAMTIIKELGHTGRTIDIFKIDCEGGEFKVMPPLLESIANGIVKVNQIQIEMHLVGYLENYTAGVESFFDAVDRANLRIFHKERNHWGCEGYGCIEYAFVDEKFLRDVNGEYVCHRV